MKTQATDNLTPANPKEGKRINTTTEKSTGISNHCSLISLNINGLDLHIKRHRLKNGYENKTHHSAVYKKNTSTTNTDFSSE